MKRVFVLILIGSILILLPFVLLAQEQEAGASSGISADAFIRDIYGKVSSRGGTLPDWEKVRGCFLKEAVVVLRISRTEMSVFSVDGFIEDFVKFYESPFSLKSGPPLLPKRDGFVETVVKTQSWEYGDIAQVLVHYTAQILGGPLPPQHGIDSWQLVKRDGRWFIASVANEIILPKRVLPPGLEGE